MNEGALTTDPSLKPKSRAKWVFENVVSLGSALILVLMVRSSVIEAFKIPSGSMIPTLLVGDNIFVNKFAYAYQVPFTDWIGEKPIYLARREPPKRGDIIVFRFPKDESVYFIKRVIGTPGDEVLVRDKRLIINGQEIPREAVPDETLQRTLKLIEDSKYSRDGLDVTYEQLGDHKAVVMNDRNSYMLENFGPIKVPANQFFVMGDNRDYSNDSRFWGFVPLDNIRGRAMFIWLSFWVSFSDSEYYFRPTRTGTVLN